MSTSTISPQSPPRAPPTASTRAAWTTTPPRRVTLQFTLLPLLYLAACSSPASEVPADASANSTEQDVWVDLSDVLSIPDASPGDTAPSAADADATDDSDAAADADKPSDATLTPCQAGPTPVITGAGPIVPQMPMNLSAAKSVPTPGCSIVKWQWKVLSKPSAAVDHTFHPSNDTQDVAFGAKDSVTGAVAVNVSGIYVIELRVWDSCGVASCKPAVVKFVTSPLVDEAIHIELTWVTPADIDLVCASGKKAGKACLFAVDCPGSACQPDQGKGVPLRAQWQPEPTAVARLMA